jgi:16S rRNA (uracil1498-N3)-methyltransferase
MPARFFQVGQWKPGDEVAMGPEESHHASRVLRLSEGDAIEIFNGEGAVGLAKILRIDRGVFFLRVDSVSTLPNPWKITVAFSLGKPPVTEFILKRATELGVRRFQPVHSRFSHPGDFKLERWTKLLLEVCKQCQETHVPALEPMLELQSWVRAWSPKPILLCDEKDRQASASLSAGTTEAAVLVGPEGGWATEEIEMLSKVSTIPFGLGRNRLRAETAALTATILAKKSCGEIP